jgi:hypothetical protein
MSKYFKEQATAISNKKVPTVSLINSSSKGGGLFSGKESVVIGAARPKSAAQEEEERKAPSTHQIIQERITQAH